MDKEDAKAFMMVVLSLVIGICLLAIVFTVVASGMAALETQKAEAGITNCEEKEEE